MCGLLGLSRLVNGDWVMTTTGGWLEHIQQSPKKIVS
jgi:hypothetical protein